MMDVVQVARELMRSLRGERSQVALSRRLGYRTNAAYSWEAGRDFPTAARFFEVAARVGVDVGKALERFYRRRPAFLDSHPSLDKAAVAALLTDLRGSMPVVELAKRAGFSRFAVARWLNGSCEPRLPQFLALIDASSLRLLDFVAAFVDPTTLPSLKEPWLHLEATRRAAHEVPWTQAVLRCLELPAYAALKHHVSGFIAGQLGITREEEQRCLSLLLDSGQIKREGEHYVVQQALTVDLRRDPTSTRTLRSFWTRIALERLEAGSDGVYSYNVFGISNADLERLRELHASYFQQMRAIIATSQPVERVAITCTQLLALDE
jgi:transcriptional regulator with XRE-family HTH domain